jgi:hypothetical protein
VDSRLTARSASLLKGVAVNYAPPR